MSLVLDILQTNLPQVLLPSLHSRKQFLCLLVELCLLTKISGIISGIVVSPVHVIPSREQLLLWTVFKEDDTSRDVVHLAVDLSDLRKGQGLTDDGDINVIPFIGIAEDSLDDRPKIALSEYERDCMSMSANIFIQRETTTHSMFYQ